MGRYNISLSHRYAGSSDNEGDIDVFFKPAFLSRVESVLRDVVAIIRGVEDIGVFQNPIVQEPGYEAIK